VIVEQRITGGGRPYEVSTIGVDLAKNVFHVHGVDSSGKVVISRQLRRKQVIDVFSKIPPCLVGMEACGTAHHWAREVSKLGHTVRLMPPSYVMRCKPITQGG
jgi:transposase